MFAVSLASFVVGGKVVGDGKGYYTKIGHVGEFCALPGSFRNVQKSAEGGRSDHLLIERS